MVKVTYTKRLLQVKVESESYISRSDLGILKSSESSSKTLRILSESALTVVYPLLLRLLVTGCKKQQLASACRGIACGSNAAAAAMNCNETS